jgi:hypothetical protein
MSKKWLFELEIKTGATTMEIGVEVPQNTKPDLPYTSHTTLGKCTSIHSIYTLKTCTSKYKIGTFILMFAYHSSVHNS